jgi:hypothetical protein
MSHSPCGSNGTKWRRICVAKQETRPVRAIFRKIYSFSHPWIVDDAAARALFRQNLSRTFPSKDAISRFDCAKAAGALHPMVERLNLRLIDFRFLNSPEQRWQRPRCSSQASECRTTASARSTPTPHSASMAMSATTASAHACSGCFTARGSMLANNPAKLNGLTKAALKLLAGMPLKAPINADNRRYRSLDFRFEEFLRTRRAHVGLGDKGYPGIDIG